MKITTYTKKDCSTVYRTSVFLGVDQITGKKVKTTVSARTKRELEQKARRKILDFEKAGSTVHRAVAVKTYQELADLWLESYQLTVKPQTYLQTKGLIANHLVPAFGRIKPEKLTSVVVQKFVNELSARYVHFAVVHSINRRILQHAVSLQILPYNPARETILPKKPERGSKAIKFIDPSDLKRLLAYMEKLSHQAYRYFFDYVLYSLLLATGCRFGELAALDWSDIDLEGATVSISKNYHRLVDKVGTPKSKAGYRIISIDPKTVNLLKLYKVRQGQIFREAGAEAPTVVFSTPTKERQNLATRQEFLDRRCKEVGIPRFTFHAFRHTHASLLLNAGISYKELQYRLGHSTLAMTMDIYGHLSKDKEKEAVAYFEKAMASL